jgi:hypothetical protein
MVSGQQWKVEEAYQDAYANDANGIQLLARQCTQRELLSYKIFPKPAKDASVFVFGDFGRQFRSEVGQLLDRVGAGDCPARAEVEAIRKDWQGKRSYRGKLRAVRDAIEENLCRAKAEALSVYLNPTDLGGYGFWEKYSYSEAKSMDEAIGNCWYSQLAFWIIEDVIDTVAACNSGSSSVLASPVKRLLSVSFTGKRVRTLSGPASGAAGKSAEDLPVYVLAIQDALTNPCTRRVSNDDIDVVHFKTEVIVATSVVPLFMEQLCRAKEHRFSGWDGKLDPPKVFKHNQITILEYKVTSIDREEDRTHELYRYGKDAVVKLDLVCEYVFDKAGYDEIKPDVVKKSVTESLDKLKKQTPRILRPTPRPTQPGAGPKPKTKREPTPRRQLPDIGF